MAQPQARNTDHRYRENPCAGHLLVWTWRKMVAGEEGCVLLAREYECLAGARAAELLDAFGIFLVMLGRGSRRTLAVGQPYCVGITNDEGQILRLIAAAQEGRGALVAAHLSWLVRASSAAAVRDLLEKLAALLTVCGVILPRADYQAPPDWPLLEVVG
jgi:hypothetical protein